MLWWALLLSISPAHSAWTLPARFPAHRLLPPRGAARARALLSRWSAAPAPPAGSRVFSPLDYGADPLGLTDSSPAMAATVAALLASCAPATQHPMANGVRDCDGAVLDLQGGDYLLSQPLAIPPQFGNLRIFQGSLRASSAFPPLRYLIEVGNATVGGAGNNIDVSLSALFLDASQVAAGCIHTEDLQGGVIGPQVYLFNFTSVGALVSKGFEVTVMQTWAAEFWFDTPKKKNGTATGNTTGIWKAGNDGVVSDCIIFSSRIGLWVSGEANSVDSVHTWNLANGNGGIGILSTASQSRFTNCYLDVRAWVCAGPLLFIARDTHTLHTRHARARAHAQGTTLLLSTPRKSPLRAASSCAAGAYV